MKLENFRGVMNRGELTSILGQSIVDMMDEMDMILKIRLSTLIHLHKSRKCPKSR